MEIDVTILMPCLNEEKTIKKCIRDAYKFLNENHINGEILIVDNGSTDNSINLIKQENARLVKCSNKGYGNALRYGFEKSLGKYIIMSDCDASYDLSNLLEFINLLDEEYDLVMGNRFTGIIEKGAMPFLNKYIGNPLLSKFAKLMFPCQINDFHSGLRAFRRDKILKLNLKSSGMELASEMVIKCVKNNYKLIEIPINLLNNHVNRKPHLRPFRDGIRHVKLIIKEKINL